MANNDSTTISVNGADGPTDEDAPHPASSDYVEKRGGKIGKTKWTVSSVACLCTFAAVCVGIALIITSALASQDSSPMDATTTPTLPADDVESAQNAWVQLVTATGEDGANNNGGLPSSVSESVLINGPASPQAKALRWLALNVASAAAAASATESVSNLPLSERYALAVLYFHWSGRMWKIPSDDWIPADMHEQYLQTSNECTWAGITCNEDLSTVTAINMTDHTIFLSALARTTLPSELGLLTGLEHLLIPGYNLQGSAKPLRTLTNLIELDLSQNQLTSAIPYLVYLEEVEVVKLGYNLLQDVVQDRTGLRKLRHIRHFDVQQNPNLTCTSENSFMEYIATGWQDLEELYLSHTNTYFKFPHHAPVIVFPKFAVLRASNTQIDGSIQYTINELTHLRILDLSSPTGSSGLVGDIHPSLGGLTSLELLDLDGNAFESSKFGGYVTCCFGFLMH